MTKENQFENMGKNAMLNVDETLEDIMENTMSENPYMLNQALLNEGHYFDLTGVYFQYKARFQSIGIEDTSNFETRDDLYFWVSRNPDKKLELNCKWAKKTNEGFQKSRGFKLDFTLDIGEEKTLKALNKKVAFSGDKNGNPASEDSYVAFVDYITNLISENDCLEVFKEDTFDFPEILDDEELDNVERDETPQCFTDYPEKVQHEALEILNDGSLFDEMSKSVSITHEGHETTRNALILMESSLFVDDGAHGLLGGESGGGKTDIALTCALNLPQKNVHIISSNSPKDIFYDFDSYDDDFNILIFDDILFNDELIKLCKLLTDNRVKDKVHKTVINGKSEKFKLKGKYEVIITYAKTLPDEELANRLFNIGVSIIDKDENNEKGKVKYKILDNNVTQGNDNALVKDIRAPIQAGVQYLIEQDMNVFNPYLSIFNPIKYNNRDINHLASMIKAKTFFEYPQRKQIKVNDELSLTIGSYEDLNFVYNTWAKDEEAQMFKLSERQKAILDILPELTIKEAFDKVDEINEELSSSQSRAYKKELMEKHSFAKSIARQLKCNVSTLKHDLDRVSEGTHKSLLEMGLVDKIQLDEDYVKSPNFYYKLKNEGEVSNQDENDVQDSKISFAHSLNSSIVKQKIILDLLIYANIVLNERGMYAIKIFCENYNEELDVEDYEQLMDFLQSFFDDFKHDEYTIRFEESSRKDKLKMFEFKDEITQSLENEDTHSQAPEETKICTSKESKENSSNTNQSKNECANDSFHILHIENFKFKDEFEEKGIDVEIAYQICNVLSSGERNLDEIRTLLCEGQDPDDFNSANLPLKIEMNLQRLVDNSYIVIIEEINQASKYALNNELKQAFEGESLC